MKINITRNLKIVVYLQKLNNTVSQNTKNPYRKKSKSQEIQSQRSSYYNLTSQGSSITHKNKQAVRILIELEIALTKF